MEKMFSNNDVFWNEIRKSLYKNVNVLSLIHYCYQINCIEIPALITKSIRNINNLMVGSDI